MLGWMGLVELEYGGTYLLFSKEGVFFVLRLLVLVHSYYTLHTVLPANEEEDATPPLPHRLRTPQPLCTT